MPVDGTYNISLNTPMGARPATLSLATSGTALSGTFSSDRGEQQLQNGAVNGNEITFSMMFASPMGEMKLDFSGTVDGDAIGGGVQFGSFGSGSFEGTRA